MKLLFVRCFAIWVALVGMAHGAYLQLDATGQLTGAVGVNVGGSLYDVTFRDGNCFNLFGGCASPSDFPFKDAATTAMASAALLSEVFIDDLAGQFDTDPSGTLGCTSSSRCQVSTPFGTAAGSPALISIVTAVNSGSNGPDVVILSSRFVAFESGDIVGLFAPFAADNVWAVWAPHTRIVTEPGMAGLMLIAGCGTVVAARNRPLRGATTRGQV